MKAVGGDEGERFLIKDQIQESQGLLSVLTSAADGLGDLAEAI